jgi:hypothetical protein
VFRNYTLGNCKARFIKSSIIFIIGLCKNLVMSTEEIELLLAEESIDKELSLVATDTIKSIVSRDFAEIVESGRTISTVPITVVKNSHWDNGPSPYAKALHITKDNGETAIAISERKAKLLITDVPKLIIEANYTEEEFLELNKKSKSKVDFSDTERARYRQLMKIHSLDYERSNLLDTLKHEWVHEQVPTPEGIYPKGMAISEIFPLYYAYSSGYQDVHILMDLLKISLGTSVYNDLINDSMKTNNAFEEFTRNLAELLGRNISQTLLNYLPASYENLRDSEPNIKWVSFPDLFAIMATYINQNITEIPHQTLDLMRQRQSIPEGNILTDDLLELLKGKALSSQ